MTAGEALPPETASEDGFKNSTELLADVSHAVPDVPGNGIEGLEAGNGNRGSAPQPVYLSWSRWRKSSKSRLRTPRQIPLSRTGTRATKRAGNQLHLFNTRYWDGALHYKAGKLTPKPEPDNVPARSPTAASGVFLALPKIERDKMEPRSFLSPTRASCGSAFVPGGPQITRMRTRALRLGLSAHTSNNANFSNAISEGDIPVTGTV